MKALLIILLSTMALFAQESTTSIELERLQEIHQREIEKLNKSYMDQLEALQGKFMKMGDFEKANQVNVEIKKYTPEAIVEVKVETTKWKWGEEDELTLHPDGVATQTRWRTKGTWKKNSDGSIRLDSGRYKFKVTFTPEGIGQAVNLTNDNKITLIPKK